MSDIGTCSTCKHWDRSRIEDGEPYGRCASAESSDGKPKRGSVPIHPAYAMDSSGYHASLRTLPTFGCNQHKDRA